MIILIYGFSVKNNIPNFPAMYAIMRQAISAGMYVVVRLYFFALILFFIKFIIFLSIKSFNINYIILLVVILQTTFFKRRTSLTFITKFSRKGKFRPDFPADVPDHRNIDLRRESARERACARDT